MVATANIVGLGGYHTKLFRPRIHSGGGARVRTSLLLRVLYALSNSLSRVWTNGPNRASAVAHTDSTDSVCTSVALVEDEVAEEVAEEVADEAADKAADVDEAAEEDADEDDDEDADEDAEEDADEDADEEVGLRHISIVL